MRHVNNNKHKHKNVRDGDKVMKNFVAVTMSDENDDAFMAFADQIRNEGFLEGMHQGMLEGIELAISLKFGDKAMGLMALLKNIQDIDLLKKIKDSIKVVNSPDELKNLVK